MLQTVTVIVVPDSDVSGMPLPQGYVANCNSYCSTWLGCVSDAAASRMGKSKMKLWKNFCFEVHRVLCSAQPHH